jgi:hypothetical protein
MDPPPGTGEPATRRRFTNKHKDDTMQGKTLLALVLAFAVASVVALGASFTWTGNGGDDDWDTCGNWDACEALVQYPGDCNADATISGTYTVDLITESIDDLTISGTVTFGDANGNDPFLSADSLTIVGGASVTIGEGATITTSDCE